jgi:cytolysin-activating lysine-acyltransferase
VHSAVEYRRFTEFRGCRVSRHRQKTLAQVLGEVVWLMSQSATHKGFLVSDLEWMVMTPMLLGQFRLFYEREKPIGVVLWGFVNDEVEARLLTGNARLRPGDWKSGERLWVTDIIAPFGRAEGAQVSMADQMIVDLKEKVFPTRELRVLTREGETLKVKVV